MEEHLGEGELKDRDEAMVDGCLLFIWGRNGVDKHPWKQEEGSVKEGDREAKEEREKPWSGP